MSSSPSPCDAPCSRDRLAGLLREAGAYRFGIARAGEVASPSSEAYDSWIAGGNHASMDYLERYPDLRRDPRLLLPGAESVIVCAFPYARPVRPEPGCLRIASYALGDDYHDVVRRRLRPVAEAIDALCGSESRVCVDTAPLRERYWAVRAGLGFIGLNCQLILPDAGSYFFLGTILTTARFEPDEPCRLSCFGCRRCIIYCPGQALATSGAPSLDARRCLSCLTIEHRGPFERPVRLGDRLYGCDTCQIACPHNRGEEIPPLPEFEPRPALLRLRRDDVLQMSVETYRELFRRSAIKRCGLDGLRRNAGAINS